ncbi:MAG: restriction endonuclease subunit S [Motiliproteus sp.]
MMHKSTQNLSACDAGPQGEGRESPSIVGKYQRYEHYKETGIERLGSVPAHWTTKRLKHMARIKNGQDYKHVETSDSENGYPVIGSGGPFTYATKFVHRGESVLLGRKGTIDKPLYIDDAFWTVDTMFYTEVQATSCAKYLYYCSLTIPFGYYSTNTALPSMTQEDLGGNQFSVPDIDEQRQIASFLDHETAKIDILIDKQQQLIQLLKEKRQAVISHAVTKGIDSNVPMKDSGVEWLGEVPEHWSVARVKFISKLESGHTPDKKIEAYWMDCNIPWVSLNDSKTLKNVDYISETKFNVNALGIENSSARMLPKNCVVFTRDASIGLTAITTCEMAVSQHLIAWVVDPKNISPEYLLLVFYAMEKELDRYTFGATIKTIGMADVKKLVCAFPDRASQDRITDYVFNKKKAIDSAVAKAVDSIALMQERRTALIAAAVTGKIDVRHHASRPAGSACNTEMVL